MLSRTRFESVYRQCERPFYNIALRWAWSPGAAQELVQETFLRLWNRRLIIGEEQAAAYAYRCLLNLCHDFARKRLRDTVPLEHDPPDKTTRGAEQELLDSQLRDALESLPDAQRDVLLLTEFAGLKHREIATLLDIAPGTVGSRRDAALKTLRNALT